MTPASATRAILTTARPMSMYLTTTPPPEFVSTTPTTSRTTTKPTSMTPTRTADTTPTWPWNTSGEYARIRADTDGLPSPGGLRSEPSSATLHQRRVAELFASPWAGFTPWAGFAMGDDEEEQ